ncbi:hypothetical protein [Trichothermofontia sp.]
MSIVIWIYSSLKNLTDPVTNAPRYYLALAGIFPAKDITVWTPAEIQEWAAVPHAFVTIALREGIVLYKKSP